MSHFWRHDLNHAFILVDIQPPDYLSIGRTGGLCRYSLHISAHRSWATWNPELLCRKPCNRIPLPDRFTLLCGISFCAFHYYTLDTAYKSNKFRYVLL